MVVAYVTTVIANTVRIWVALEIQQRSIEVNGLSGNQLHRVAGIVVYFGFLIALYLVMERSAAGRSKSFWMFPLVVYYAMTLGVPLVNGSFLHAGFWEHFSFVLVLPLIILGPFLMVSPRGGYSRAR
jgi:UDP-N-acetylmuramyl pentapeptide phosphotransferase/UDP-N-acetylglucosamine-1-phosphate transferase